MQTFDTLDVVRTMTGMVAKLMVLLTFALTLPALGQTTGPAADSVRVTTFNVRNSNSKDGPDAWTERRAFFLDTLQGADADLIGLQEVLQVQAEEIRTRLSSYEFIGVARNDGKQAGEYSPILFRRDRFERRDWGTIWLSPTPDAVGSKGWDAALPRIATWLKLADKQNGNRELLVMNTHFDHKGKEARVESAKLLRKTAADLGKGLPVIIMGDFNVTEDDPPYATLVRPEDNGPPKLADAYREVHPQRSKDESSFNGFKGTRHGSRIDWILHTPEFKAVDASIDYANKDGRYPSDHYPVHVELRWVTK
jgi:endonuclease/exonuclease/phosphatase family metal-dependent hydrolase